MSVIARLEGRVERALLQAGLSRDNAVIVVAVSGGPDSSALLHCLNRLSRPHELKLHVAHLNHDFRGAEASGDADFTRALSRSLGIPATIDEANPLDYQTEDQQRRGVRNSSIEQASREVRYAFLAEVARRVGASVVATGHTADDQAETVLLHILRGSGVQGLRGMTALSAWPDASEDGELRLFRPLLEVTKADAVAYCRALGHDFRDDSDNYLPKFTRNRIRRRLLPFLESEFNPRVREALARLSRTAAVELDYLEEETGKAWARVVVPADYPAGEAVCFHRPALASLHPALQALVLRRGYAEVAGDTRRLRESHLSQMSRLAAGGPSQGTVQLPGGLRLYSDYDRLWLSRQPYPECPLPALEGEWPVGRPSPEDTSTLVADLGCWRVSARRRSRPERLPPADSFTACFDPHNLGQHLSVRARRAGDRFQPLGMVREKKLQDFFTDARIPRQWRDRIPLLVSERGIAWVVGHRIAQWAGVRRETPGETPVVEVRFEPGARLES